MSATTQIKPLEPLKNIAKAASVPQQTGVNFSMVSTSELRIDMAYQRKVSEKSLSTIRKIVREFSWSRFGALSVAQHPDGFIIIDGQHRAIAAHTLGITAIPCMISEGDLVEQAGDFVSINNDRTRVQPVDKFRARIAAGDKKALELAQILTDIGITTDVVPGTPLRPGQTRAISVLEKLMQTAGPGILFTTLEALTDAQPEQMNLLIGFNIKIAIQLIANVIGSGGDMNEVVKLLEVTDFDSLHVDALSANRMFGGNIANHG
ncbi:MAG: ParB N-terminal domain-containing protein, partial [Alphaproteobacteria bacterium]|nr:ParB N-terminal domain-containing protein [Alphaproteobacteria bacterium]